MVQGILLPCSADEEVYCGDKKGGRILPNWARDCGGIGRVMRGGELRESRSCMYTYTDGENVQGMYLLFAQI